MDNRLKNEDMIGLSMFIRSLDSGYLRDKMISFLKREQVKSTKLIMIQAIKDKHISEKEIEMMIKKFSVKREHIAEIFKAVYDRGVAFDNEEKGNKVFMVTEIDSPMWKMRDYAKEKFDIDVIDSKDALIKLVGIEKDNIKQRADYIG